MMARRSIRRLLAILVLVASWAPALASIVIAWVFELREAPVPGAFLSASPIALQSRFDDIGVTVALIYGALSAALIARRPHPVAILLSIHAVGSGIAALGVQWGLLGEQVPGLPLWGLLLHAAGWGYVPGTVSTTIVPLLVLRGARPVGHRVLIGIGIALAAVAFAATLVHQAPGAPANPLAIPDPSLQPVLPWIYGVAVTAAVGLSIVVAVLLAVRWAGTPPEGRRRLGWLVVGHAFLTLSYAALVLPAGTAVPDWVWRFAMIAPVVGQIFYPSSVLVLVLGPRLRGIDIAVSRVLVWSIVTVAAATSYLVLGDLLVAVLDWPREGIGVLAAAVVAVALIPAHDWLGRRIARLVWDDGSDPDELVRRLGDRVGDLESGAHGVAELATALRSALRLGWVEIRSATSDGVVAIAGAPGAHVVECELLAGGRLVGTLAVGGRGDEPIPRRTRRELAELVPLVAVVLRLADAGAALEAARDAVLAARHEERRALRRELHDGIGPALAGIGFGLAAVDRSIDDDPVAARDLIDRLAADVRDRLREVRALVRAIRPEETDIDLAADLADLAEDFEAAGPRIEIDVADAAAVPRAARRSLAFIAAEAVHNAVRHADAARLRIVVAADEDDVVLEIADDGRGFSTAATGGVGLSTMRERAADLGAHFEVRSSAGAGTTVRVVLPLPAGVPAPTLEVPA